MTNIHTDSQPELVFTLHIHKERLDSVLPVECEVNLDKHINEYIYMKTDEYSIFPNIIMFRS